VNGERKKLRGLGKNRSLDALDVWRFRSFVKNKYRLSFRHALGRNPGRKNGSPTSPLGDDERGGHFDRREKSLRFLTPDKSGIYPEGHFAE
jgi:hypothetical protein